ncbi:helix-turn-helix domain-containing protein [Mycolicibacterium mageritense]|uniref:helix-turn-helix domain-containing protein n=1 Tax=Mycolicibacterium mageritense TaxID=53462 RepID=UPI001E4036D6|nr:helix-turn-helix domain-containing protein [Mycolicibacterium mageritense]MCC9182588.1 helix-turn-helix domain-containing protein [Mycolicibacterium mageritense]
MPESDATVLGRISALSRRMGPELRRRWVRRVLASDDLTPTQKTVLVALETYADVHDGTNAYPGETNLAEDCGDITTRAVRAALARGRDLGLIERTAVENPRAGLAAVYRLVFDEPETAATEPETDPITGTGVPVNNSTTGTAVPVNNRTTGTAVPVNNSITGTATSPSPEPPFLPPSPTPTPGLRNWGTSPEPRIAEPHTPAPSRFCAQHPQGGRPRCPNCLAAQVNFDAWQAQRREIRESCPWCHGTSTRERLDGEIEKCDHQTPPQIRGNLALVPPLPDDGDVRAAQ